MSRFLTKKVALSLGLAAVLAAGGVATASNMGFKFVKNYTAIFPATNTIALPYFQTQFATTRDLFNDIGVNAKEVCKVNAVGAPSCWLGDFTGSPVRPIINEQGYTVRVQAATTQVIVGSHDPALNVGATMTVPFPAKYLISLPYHSTYLDTRAVFNDVPGAVQVCKVNATGAPSCWLGDFTGSPLRSIIIGDAYSVSVSPAAPTWIPDHY